MHLFILGICGTFMAGIAALAREMGHEVSGCDANPYPPMTDVLADLGIDVRRGYLAEHLTPAPDLVIVGNAMTRGNPAVEHMLNRRLRFTSGPAWLHDHVLNGRHVLTVAGTHGKTTTTAMLAWILDHAGRNPGFLIGGAPGNFDRPARLGSTGYDAPFVIEADEYDTAFFDKRSKFVHYSPVTAIINNLEFDHADIFDDIADIQRQFHHLVRIVPENGTVIARAGEPTIDEVLARGCWSKLERIGAGESWDARSNEDGSYFSMLRDGQPVGAVNWDIVGQHNVDNAAAAVAAASAAGVDVEDACDALARFRGVKRRLELRADVSGIAVYDDFAHHPTAVERTLSAVRSTVGDGRILAILDPASNTMKLGVHRETLAGALADADFTWVFHPPTASWDIAELARGDGRIRVVDDVERLAEECAEAARPGDRIVIMSNSGFGGLHERLIDRLRARG